jgi:hypothetical protein
MAQSRAKRLNFAPPNWITLIVINGALYRFQDLVGFAEMMNSTGPSKKIVLTLKEADRFGAKQPADGFYSLELASGGGLSRCPR